MIIYTNIHNIEDAFVRLVKNDKYDKGNSDFSATGLAVPPRARVLLETNDVYVDVSSRVDSIIGQATHLVAERAARPEVDVSETRFFSDFIVDGVKYIVSAQVDLYEVDSGLLLDWKTTKAYAFNGKKPPKIEYVQQLNVGAELLRRNGYTPSRLKIMAFLKDWKRTDAVKSGYPKLSIICPEIEMWSPERCVAYIEDRVRAHVLARTRLPWCSPSETWYGNRCEFYCDAKSACDQYKQIRSA